MLPEELHSEIARCDAEIASMQGQFDKPAWLVSLGILDWEQEKRLIRAELEGYGSPDFPARSGLDSSEGRQ